MSKQFYRVQTKLNMPYVKKGIRVFCHHKKLMGTVISSHDEGFTINILFDGQKEITRYFYPKCGLTYYSKKGKVITDFPLCCIHDLS